MRFALDQNFPQPILDALSRYIQGVQLTPLRDLDPSLVKDTEDWEILLALAHRGWDGLITADSGMLSDPKVLSVLHQTGLTLVVSQGAGDDPLLATGLLFVHLDQISKNSRPGTPQIWELRAGHHPYQKPWNRLQGLAERKGKGITAKDLYLENCVPDDKLPL